MAAPTSSYVVFDPLVFDWGFSIMDIIPSINKVIMPRNYQKIAAGQAVAIVINIQDEMTTVHQRYNFNPDITPQIQIYDPLGNVLQAYDDMVFMAITGYYVYQYQTDEDDNVGPYTATFTAENGIMAAITSHVTIYEIIES